MGVSWQDEVKWLYNLVYAPEKERWEKSKNTELGFSHWCAYLSEYAELRRQEIRHGSQVDILEARMKKLHPIAWSWAMDWYNQQ